MVRPPLIKLAVALGLNAAIAVGLSLSAHAFTETTIPPAKPGAVQISPESQLELKKSDDGSGLALSSPGEGKHGETELNIPGIGSVGSLPKLDFGLELLYGGGNGPAAAEKPQDDKNGDVLIKGTIKHRF